MRHNAKFWSKFKADTAGSAIVEMAILIPLLLLLIFGILEYGRLYWVTGTAQKATAIASRIAAVRPAACPDVPEIISSVPVNPGSPIPKYGTLCRSGNVCLTPGEKTCALNLANPTGQEIWDRITALLPPGSTPANVRLRYTFDERLGFLGGPYSPIVTAELTGLEFRFVSPLGKLAALAAGDATLEGTHPNSITLSSMSSSMPGEDLASGAAN